MPSCSGAASESTLIVTCAWPLAVSEIDWTDPTLAGPISTSSPVTRPPASWKSAWSVYDPPPPSTTRTTTTIATASAATAATRAIMTSPASVVWAFVPFSPEAWLQRSLPHYRALSSGGAIILPETATDHQGRMFRRG